MTLKENFLSDDLAFNRRVEEGDRSTNELRIKLPIKSFLNSLFSDQFISGTQSNFSCHDSDTVTVFVFFLII